MQWLIGFRNWFRGGYGGIVTQCGEEETTERHRDGCLNGVGPTSHVFKKAAQAATLPSLRKHLSGGILELHKKREKNVFSPLALSHSKNHGSGFSSFPLQQRRSPSSNCHHICRGYVSPLHTSVWEFSIILDVMFVMASGSPSPIFLLEVTSLLLLI